METISAGQIVFVQFPFSDLTGAKMRPAVVLANVGRNDWLLCQITSKTYADTYAIGIHERDFASGSLIVSSYVRPAKLFTAHIVLIEKVVATLTKETHSAIVASIIKTLQSEIH